MNKNGIGVNKISVLIFLISATAALVIFSLIWPPLTQAGEEINSATLCLRAQAIPKKCVIENNNVIVEIEAAGESSGALAAFELNDNSIQTIKIESNEEKIEKTISLSEFRSTPKMLRAAPLISANNNLGACTALSLNKIRCTTQ